ncbi:MAG: hypothetical protein K2H33_07590 [Muribaculaceae bacterium]|nr:hypothetical protein [Muribaculaceae bacterium]
MKKQLTLLAACALVGAAAANATCWRINPSPFAKAQFQTVAEAMADINVLPGDTLLIDPGKHGDVDVRSRDNMTIIGTGYFLDKNKAWAESQSSVVNYVYLSAGSKIEGCDAAYISSSNNGGVTVSRCKAPSISISGANHLVEGCFVNTILGGNNCVVRNNIVQHYLNGQSGCIIENNIVCGSGYSSYQYNLISDVSNSTIRNNIFINTLTGFDSNQVPNACKIYSSNCTNNVIQNNVYSVAERYVNTSDLFKGYPNNYYVGATVENTFVNEGSDDAKWQLLDSSAAKGAATHGGDCGAFGGATPYVLSGIPMFLPHITEALVPAKPTDGKITVKLKIENQNE